MPQLHPLIVLPEEEIIFKGPFTDIIVGELILINKNKKRIAYKIKTTAPKQYCVRPNSGFINGQQSLIISLMLQPFNYTSSEKLKHKFLIQYIHVLDDLNTSFDQLWKDIEPDKLLETKIKCIFQMTEDTSHMSGEIHLSEDNAGILQSLVQNQANNMQQLTSGLTGNFFLNYWTLIMVILSGMVGAICGKYLL